MCASYIIQESVKELGLKYGYRTDLDQVFTARIAPYMVAPVVHGIANKPKISLMNFSLIQAWASEKRQKFATHNARIETIDQKATWKKPFLQRHCLVPITAFFEPIYVNEFAGNMVRFSAKSGDLLFAAGIWDQWLDKSTGQVLESFAIITGEPPSFIKNTGHDRCPIFLSEKGRQLWLGQQNASAAECRELLAAEQANVDFVVEKDRAMREGWQKRINAQ